MYIKCFTVFSLVLVVKANDKHNEYLEAQIIQAETAKDIAKIDQETSSDASHGTAYNSIISNYYTNDWSQSRPSTPSKSETIERLKSIFRKRDQMRDKMQEDSTRIDRGMIPAPLLARVKGQYVEDDIEDVDDFDGIPAPLLVGGAYRKSADDADSILRKRLGLEDSSRKRMHLKKIKKRKVR